MDDIIQKTCLYAIGDIHGRVDLLSELHERILQDAKKYPDFKLKIIYLGDYIDRGPHSKEVIEQLIHSPLTAFQAIHLKGNHENMLLNFLKNPKNAEQWLRNGGLETLKNYGVDILSASNVSIKNLQKDFQQKLPAEHLIFFKSLIPFYIEGNYFFCHGGVNPDIPLDQQTEEDLTWIREPFLSSTKSYGKIIVHGHSITKEPVILSNRIGIDTGAIFTNILTCAVLKENECYFLNTESGRVD